MTRRRQPNYESEIRRILIFSGIFFALIVVAAAALFVLAPFRVDFRAVYDRLEGTLEVSDVYGNELSLVSDIDRPIEVGETVRLKSGGTVRIEIAEGSKAFAYLYGPAEWSVTTAWRDATALNHIQGKGDDYQIVLEQRQGVVVYDLSRADPPLEKLNLVIRFPDGEVRPKSVCFQASAAAQGIPSAVVDVPCDAAITPRPQPTLPSLP